MSQKLREVISKHNEVLGSSETGKSWCLKALHPSDPITEVQGIPDESNVPSVFMNYQATFTLSCPNSTATSWGFNAQLVPHPVGMMAAISTDSLGSVVGSEFLNPQLNGSTHAAKARSWVDMFESWRLAYQSVTVYQDGPDLANQGTLVACQAPVRPSEWFASQQGTTTTAALSKILTIRSSDRASFEYSQSMPSAYFDVSKNGAYMPLKLGRTSQRWSSRSDIVGFGVDPESVSTVIINRIGLPNMYPGNATGGSYPFYSLCPTGTTGTSGNTIFGEGTPNFLNDIWGDISVRNAAPTTSYTFFVRMGLECQVLPSSQLASLQHISPVYDAQALETYFSVSRQLKDAYPKDYNDLGKIWDVIKSVLGSIAPVLSSVPKIGMPLSLLAAGVPVAGEAIRGIYRNVSSDRQAMSKASATDLNTARNQMRNMMEKPNKKKKQKKINVVRNSAPQQKK